MVCAYIKSLKCNMYFNYRVMLEKMDRRVTQEKRYIR